MAIMALRKRDRVASEAGKLGPEQLTFWNEPASHPPAHVRAEAAPRDGGTSPFDVIRHVDERGEHWFAREMAPYLGYTSGRDSWKNFSAVVKKVKEVLGGMVSDLENHCADVGTMVGIGSGASRKVSDFRLSRLACYLVAMDCDSSKPEVAVAKVYFAQKTREAELGKKARKAKDPIREWREKYKTDQETAEERILLIGDNKDCHSMIATIDPDAKGEDYAIFNNTGYKAQFGKDAKGLRVELGMVKKRGPNKGKPSDETPLNHMSKEALSANRHSKIMLLRRVQDAIAGGVKLSKEQVYTGFSKISRSVSENTLEQLGDGHAWQVVDDPARGKIIDAVRQLPKP